MECTFFILRQLAVEFSTSLKLRVIPPDLAAFHPAADLSPSFVSFPGLQEVCQPRAGRADGSQLPGRGIVRGRQPGRGLRVRQGHRGE